MKTVLKHKIGIFAVVLLLIASTNLSAQTERITTDASQAVPNTEDTPNNRQLPKGRVRSADEQFKRFKGILPSNNKMGIMTVGGGEAFGTTLCRIYTEEFETQFSDANFSKTHFKLSADEFALAYILFNDSKIQSAFKTPLELANERASVKVGGTEKSYEQILVDRKIYGNKSEVKQVIKNARKELEQYAG